MDLSERFPLLPFPKFSIFNLHFSIAPLGIPDRADGADKCVIGINQVSFPDVRLTGGALHDRLSITMKTATVADLRNNFASISKWIHDGEAVTITKRGLLFATLSPARKRKKAPPVDRLARIRKMFPKGPTKGDIQDVIDYDRGER